MDYKLEDIDKKKMENAARRALMIVEPLYFTWTVEQQEVFKVTMTEEQEHRIKQALLELLFDIQCSPDMAHSVWRDLRREEQCLLDWLILLTKGIGKDCLWLNEPLPEGVTLLDFDTLYDFDRAEYINKERAKKQEDESYEGRDYFAWPATSWVRMLIDDDFYYGSLTSLATYLHERVGDEALLVIEQLIPHLYKPTKNHGKKGADGRGFVFETRLDAGGYEDELDELYARWRRYRPEIWYRLSEAFSTWPPLIYRIENPHHQGREQTFIFSNAATIKHIRWKHFLDDCAPFFRDASPVEKYLKDEIEAVTNWLHDTYTDIMKNANYKVRKFRKKRRMLMTRDENGKMIFEKYEPPPRK